ncbi:recombinase family protein [Microbispora sp. ZYX-F-249]|uniref:Recombinase family protein n=1 Tax=Microbispora maris TaxID=3144104 RepID=A0ABV0AU80_9ACTN
MVQQRRRRGKGYVRVSAIMGREELFSPEIQEESIRRLFERENIELLDVVMDLDKSGRGFAERKIKQMIQEVQRGDYEVVGVWKWNRFGRNMRLSLANIHELEEEAGGEVMAATEPGDGRTTMGRFSRNQMLSVAELQSDMISDSWKDTHAVRLRMGLPHSGHARFGYVRDGKGFRPDEELNGPALAEVYERWVSGEKLWSVARDMTEMGVRAPNGDILDNSRWLTILDTGFAAGLIRKRKPGSSSKRFDNWDWFPGAHEALISRELWEAYTRKRLASLGRNWADPKAKYSLSGLVTCGRCFQFKCGATGTPKKPGDVMFRCRGVVTKECKGVYGNLSLGEAAVLEWLENRATDGGKVESLARKAATVSREAAAARRLEKVIADTSSALDRLLDLYESGGLSKVKYLERKAKREEEQRQARRDLEELRGDRVKVPATFYRDLHNAWPRLSDDRKRQMLKQVVKEIVLHPAGHPGERWEVVPY